MIVRESPKSKGMRNGCAHLGMQLTHGSQSEPAELAAAVTCRGAPQLTIWTSQIRTAAREKLSVTLAYQAPSDVARRAPRR
jgi:hypothetical protein